MLYPWVRSGKGFFTIEIGQEIFCRVIFSLPLIQVGQFSVTG